MIPGIDPSPLRLIILMMTVASIGVWLLVARRYQKLWYAIPPLLWQINVALFQLARLGYPHITALNLNAWSLMIHLHGCLTLLGIGLFLLVKR